tara:strand:+ start:7330 stop:8310 length:981 start_codon:yes stop_codon:yes gene_type:complete
MLSTEELARINDATRRQAATVEADKSRLLNQPPEPSGVDHSAIKRKLEKMGLFELANDLKVCRPASLASLDEFITEDPAMLRLKKQVEYLCEMDDPVLIHGESGTGKELIARALHGRKSAPFIAVNTTALPLHLMESELFGHAKGSFTGADSNKIGILEGAGNGTVFLDEIGDMELTLQSKLLRVLQEKVIRPVGTNAEREIHCRVVAATHQVIRKEPSHGAKTVIWKEGFRQDLYWRLATHTLHISPLRDRPEDIREILDAVIDPDQRLPETFRDEMVAMQLEGNFRELNALCQRKFLAMKVDDTQGELYIPGIVSHAAYVHEKE